MKQQMKRLTATWLLLVPAMLRGGAQNCVNNSDDVRILVAYTSAAAASTPNLLQTVILPSVSNMNLAFNNSGVQHNVKLVRAVQIDYNETNSLNTSLNDFRYGNGPFSVINTLRQVYHADICVLITRQGDNAGQAAGIGVDRADAYCVVKNQFLVSRFTIPHELGHIYGCRHEIALDATPGDNHGYVFPRLKDGSGYYLHTIMAYGTTENQDVLTNPIPYYSNPSLTYMGETLGDAGYANETRNINLGYFRLKGAILSEPITIAAAETVKAGEMADINAFNYLTNNSGVDYIVENGATASLQVENTNGGILLQPGFEAKTGSTATIEVCNITTTGRAAAAVSVAPAESAVSSPQGITASPNPFRNLVTIRYYLPAARQVSLTVYNSAGRPVQQLLSGQWRQAGPHTCSFNGGGLPPGMYVYRLAYTGGTQTGRLIKLP